MAREDASPGRRTRLDQPLEARRSIRPSVDSDTFGRISERVARFIGSWRFIAYMSAFIAFWLLWNVLAPESVRFDPRWFIGLTLLLSLQASYAAPLILLAQNRQTDRDRVTYDQDRLRTERLIADTEYLSRELAALRSAIGEVATRDFIRSELRDLVEEISPPDPDAPAADGRRTRNPDSR
jgi:uncharacterized membrane protein